MILDVLRRAKELDEHAKLQAQTATALMFFAGVRLAKLAGQRGRLRWPDAQRETKRMAYPYNRSKNTKCCKARSIGNLFPVILEGVGIGIRTPADS